MKQSNKKLFRIKNTQAFLTEKQVLNLLKGVPSLALYIENLSDNMIRYLINKSFLYARFIKHKPNWLINKIISYAMYSDYNNRIDMLGGYGILSEYLKLNELNEQQLIKLVRKSPKAICKIKSPSEKVQLAAFKKDKSCIKYIKNPCDKLLALTAFS